MDIVRNCVIFLCRTLTALSKRLYRPWLQIDWIWRRTGYYRKFKKSSEFVENLLEMVTTELFVKKKAYRNYFLILSF